MESWIALVTCSARILICWTIYIFFSLCLYHKCFPALFDQWSSFNCQLRSINIIVKVNKKAVLSRRWPHNAPYIWVPSKFSGLPDYPHGHYSQHFHGHLFRSTLWMFPQNLKFVPLPVPEITGGTQKIWAVPGYAHAPFSPKFLMDFYSDRPCKYTHQI